MTSPPIFLYVPGLACRMAIRPDLAKNLSNLIERGSFVPLFPVFPALPAPMLATLRTGRWPGEHGVLLGPAVDADADAGVRALDSFDRACRERGPADPALAEAFRALDDEIGALAEGCGDDVVIVSDGALSPAAASIDIDAALRDRFGDRAAPRTEEQVSFIRTPLVSDVALFVQSLDRGMRVLSTAAERAVYRIDHPNAGDVVAIAPPNRRFGSAGPRGTRGHLPFRPDDYGVLVSSKPLPWADGRRFLLAVEAARALSGATA
jgi:hypothetical protein